MKQMDEKTKRNLISGAAGTAGAAVGVAVGSMAAGTAQAANNTDIPSQEEEGQQDSNGGSQQASQGNSQQSGSHHQDPAPSPQPDPQPDPQPNPQPNPQSNNEHDVEVLDYTSDENGDLAVVRIDNDTYYVLDADQDGNADYVAMDQNHDGQLQQDEIHDVQGQGIGMQQFRPENTTPTKPDNTGGEGGNDNGGDVEVVSYETVTNDDGSQMDVAVVSAGSDQVLILDVDQNGEADYMAADMNDNGNLEADEIVDVSDQHIQMQPLQAAAQGSGDYGQPDAPIAQDSDYLAQGGDIDYVNDANVDDFMA